jgi:repressor LexA
LGKKLNMMDSDLTDRQFRVLERIFKHIRAKGQPPTVRELCNHFGFASTRTAYDHLRALEKKGYLACKSTHRGIELVWPRVWQLFGIPIVGRVPAGRPRFAYAELEGTLTPDDFYPAGEGYLALRVQGDSMTGAGILPNDIVVVREQPIAEPGDIVVALIGDVATVKRLAKRRGMLYLEPANPAYDAIRMDGGKILGKVITVLRDLR